MDMIKIEIHKKFYCYCCVSSYNTSSPLNTQHLGERAKTGRLGIRIMCLSGATCLPTDCCFSELALLKSNSAYWSRTKRTSSSSHWKLTCSRHDIAELALNNNHSLIVEDPIVPVKCRTAIKELFLYLYLYLSVMLDSLSSSFTSISVLTKYVLHCYSLAIKKIDFYYI